MNMRTILFAGALAIAPGIAPAANQVVTLNNNAFTPNSVTINVGDTVTFQNQGGVHNVVSDPGAPNTFTCANGCVETGGNGIPSGANWSAVVTFLNPGQTRYHCEVHGGPGGLGMSGVVNVVGVAVPPPIARDDRVELRMNAPAVDIAVLANDITDPARLVGGALIISQAPAAGTVTVQDNGTPGDAGDDVLRYTLPPDAAVLTDFGYRVCHAGGACDEGVVQVVSRALTGNQLALQVPTDVGYRELSMSALPAMPGARFEATALVAPFVAEPQIASDPSPGSPWDDGMAGTFLSTGLIPAPGDGQPQDWGVVVDATPLGGNIDLFVGHDANLDGQASVDELRCTSAMSGGAERCELALSHPGGGDVRYWALIQNRGGAATGARIEWAQLPLRPDNIELVATGPGSLAEDAVFNLRLGWNDPTMVDGEVRFGFFVATPVPGTDFGWVPVRLERIAGDPSPVVLASGVDHTLRLAAGAAHERMFIDVPAGAQSLTVTSTSAGNIDLYLARPATASSPGIDPAPARSSAAASATTGGGNENLVLDTPTLVPGRWYVTPVNVDGAAVDATLRATVAGTAPAVRAGSYYNAARAGHGLFVYPAADQRVVIWYTYFQDNSPTWYYLQGTQPGANGAWTGPVYRSAWDGDSNFLRVVGHATMVPTGPDAFTWSYSIDGQTGSEPFAALGRGCPTSGGTVRDASSHWFDPATAGSGYSVQLFDNYEFFAAFVYDGQGSPRFLLAELPAVGADTQSFALEQVTGFCPTCPRTGTPTREDVGTFTRTFAGGQLANLQLDAVYGGGIPGAWTGDDAVQPLGGPGTLQGCDN